MPLEGFEVEVRMLHKFKILRFKLLSWDVFSFVSRAIFKVVNTHFQLLLPNLIFNNYNIRCDYKLNL